jgi:GTPase Era involved in 16S rRNA processing
MGKNKKEVVITESYYKEKESLREFSKGITPWACTRFEGTDFGVDFIVEIIVPTDFEQYRPESKYFLVQIKSSTRLTQTKDHINFTVEVKKIFQWLRANLPVIFVLYDLNEKKLFYLWINDDLVSYLDKHHPNWGNQNTVTVKIPKKQEITKQEMSEIATYVDNWRMIANKFLEPGTYFNLKNRVGILVESFDNVVNGFNFQSTKKAIEQHKSDLELSIYKIALSGLSRVGKSSLINALLKKKVSPVDIWQTTGVPIQILPGKEDHVEINFLENKPTIKSAFDLKLVEKFASQQINEDNKEKVYSVTIFLKNQQLERGVSFYDIPGLDDPSDTVTEYSWQTINKSNAIIYVIDAQTAENGGFIFKGEYKRHLVDLIKNKDKIFLVFNRVDLLSPEKIIAFKTQIEKSLAKFNLWDKLSGKIYFIAASPNNEKALSKESHRDSLEKLENDIWKYLLSESNLGFYRLKKICEDVNSSVKDFKGILNTRLLDTENRKKLDAAITTIKSKLPAFTSTFHSKKANLKVFINNYLDNRRHIILGNLEDQLHKIKPDSPLPSDKEIKNSLINEAHKAIELTNNQFGLQINSIKEDIDFWIEDNLKQVREIVNDNSQGDPVDMEDLSNMKLPDIDLSSAWGMGLLGAVVGFFVNPAFALGIGFVSFLGSLIFSSESIRKKRIANIMGRIRPKYEEAFNNIKYEYEKLVDKQFETIRGYINRKLNAYFSDIQNQLNKIEPLTETQKAGNVEAFKKMDELKIELKKLEGDILRIYSGVINSK